MNKDYFKDLSDILFSIEVSDIKGRVMSLDKAISQTIKMILACNKRDNKLIFMGNGGSASIASHIATDFLKNAEVPALTFNDASLITCLSNDLGYEYTFRRPIEMLARQGDIVFTISSSGKSENIIAAARAARRKRCFLITLSGFSPKNPLRKMGNINFYIPSSSYGYVEISHLVICHCIVDKLIESKK